jgi:hypothetical protein
MDIVGASSIIVEIVESNLSLNNPLATARFMVLFFMTIFFGIAA